MGKQKERDAMLRMAGAQERVARTTEQFGTEDRAANQEIRELIEPFAASLRQLFRPEEYADIERPARPDFTPQYVAEHKREVADIEDDYNTQVADAADYAASMGLKRTGVPGMAMGQIARGKAGLRSGSRENLTDRKTAEQEAGWMDKLQAYYDNLNKRREDVGLATTGANISQGQQSMFNPSQWFGQASSGFGSAAGTTYNAAQLPGAWSRIGGAVSGAANAGSKFVTPKKF